MANIWITLTLADRDTGEALGEKAFFVDFSATDPAVWFANALEWARQALAHRSDLLVLETQERILAARRAELEAAVLAAQPPAPPPV